MIVEHLAEQIRRERDVAKGRELLDAITLVICRPASPVKYQHTGPSLVAILWGRKHAGERSLGNLVLDSLDHAQSPCWSSACLIITILRTFSIANPAARVPAVMPFRALSDHAARITAVSLRAG